MPRTRLSASNTAVQKITNLDGVHSANRNPRDCHTRKHMAANLKHSHRDSILQDSLGRPSESGKPNRRAGKQKAEARHEAKLDNRQRNWILELGEDCLSSVR